MCPGQGSAIPGANKTETAPVLAKEPQVKLETETTINKDGSTKITSDLEIKPRDQQGTENGGVAGPPGPQGPPGPPGQAQGNNY